MNKRDLNRAARDTFLLIVRLNPDAALSDVVALGARLGVPDVSVRDMMDAARHGAPPVMYVEGVKYQRCEQ